MTRKPEAMDPGLREVIGAAARQRRAAFIARYWQKSLRPPAWPGRLTCRYQQ